MLRRPASQRPGITLLEVLTAIFIMGIGMLALLTLFPLGALSMARAIRDDRAATMAANAASLAATFEIRKDADVDAAMTQPDYKLTAPPDVDRQAYIPVDPNDPSNPVFIDPHYVIFNPTDPPRLGKVGTGAALAANLKTPGIRRAAPGFLRGSGGGLVPQLINKWFTLQDEIEFDTFGGPVNRTGGGNASISRPGTYTYAYMVRRPRHGTPELIELTVVVYSSRVTDVYDAEVPPIFGVPTSVQERTYYNSLGMWNAGLPRNQILLAYPSIPADVPFNPPEKPNIRKGTWLLDVSWTPPNPPAAPTSGRTVNGHFYRVENVTESAGGFLIELDREIKANISALTVMRNVIAVVERGTTWTP